MAFPHPEQRVLVRNLGACVDHLHHTGLLPAEHTAWLATIDCEPTLDAVEQRYRAELKHLDDLMGIDDTTWATA